MFFGVLQLTIDTKATSNLFLVVNDFSQRMKTYHQSRRIPDKTVSLPVTYQLLFPGELLKNKR